MILACNCSSIGGPLGSLAVLPNLYIRISADISKFDCFALYIFHSDRLASELLHGAFIVNAGYGRSIIQLRISGYPFVHGFEAVDDRVVFSFVLCSQRRLYIHPAESVTDYLVLYFLQILGDFTRVLVKRL
ncbi:hypothetical protein D3C75_844990 [compost metagenome]